MFGRRLRMNQTLACKNTPCNAAVVQAAARREAKPVHVGARQQRHLQVGVPAGRPRAWPVLWPRAGVRVGRLYESNRVGWCAPSGQPTWSRKACFGKKGGNNSRIYERRGWEGGGKQFRTVVQRRGERKWGRKTRVLSRCIRWEARVTKKQTCSGASRLTVAWLMMLRFLTMDIWTIWLEIDCTTCHNRSRAATKGVSPSCSRWRSSTTAAFPSCATANPGLAVRKRLGCSTLRGRLSPPKSTPPLSAALQKCPCSTAF